MVDLGGPEIVRVKKAESFRIGIIDERVVVQFMWINAESESYIFTNNDARNFAAAILEAANINGKTT